MIKKTKWVAIVLSIITSSILMAETTILNDITVTANKQGNKKVSQIAGSVSVVDDIKIADQNIDETTKLTSLTPSFYITKTGPTAMTTFASMRGITGGMTGIPAVGFYVDDIYYSGLDMALFDIERIEILKGPQGTLYGRNSEAGIVNIVTKKGKMKDSAKIGIDYSSFNTIKTNAYINKIINKDTVLRAAIRYTKTDGYFTNKYNNDDKIGKNITTDFRVFLDRRINDKLKFTLGYEKQDSDSPSYAQFAAYDSKDLRKDINVDALGKTSKKSQGLNLNLKYDTEDMKIVSITSVRDEQYKSANDVDFNPFDLVYLDLAKDIDYISEELKFMSNNNDDFEWIGGVFLLLEKDKREYNTWMNFANMGMGVPGETLNQKSDTKTTGTALFGEVSKIIYDIKITFGLRYDREKKEFNYTQTGIGGVGMLAAMGYANETGNKSKTFDAWLPKLSLMYEKNENFIPYVIISKGYRSGGFNDKEKMGTSYKPEFTTNYEIGFKSSLANNLSLNGSLYYIKWDDMQVEVLVGTSVYTDNASTATSKGVELELDYMPTDNLSISMGISKVEAKYDSYSRGTVNYSGKKVVDVPETTFNLSSTYRDASGIYASVNYSKFGKLYFDNGNTKSQSYAISNIKIGYEEDDYDVYIYGNNILDEEYKTRAFEVSNAWYARAGAPQSFGVALNYRF
ncbi:TonB-dependent receptor [Sulfurimonas sp.]|uniref:TonB-dependent receptor n=1 Tax=Sulfurimonas sp. TaxID=2022749 RepID=UPI002B4A0D97|nr:TonB-dependent receptor [Sulfurimonas sp.]